MKKQNPAHEITVVERNKPYDTFGWGVVFSDQTLGNLQAADPPTAAEILGAFNHWDDIEVNIRGQQDPLRRPRLLRHRPQAPAQHPAEALRGPGREAGVRDRRAGRRAVSRRRPHHRQRRPEQPHPRASTPPPTSPTSTCAIAASSGWARTSSSRPSPSPSRRPSTAGSRPMPTSSTATPPPSSSRRPRRSGGRPAWTRWRRRSPSPSAKSCSPSTWTGSKLMSNASHLRGSAQWIRFPARGLPAPGSTTTAARRWC